MYASPVMPRRDVDAMYDNFLNHLVPTEARGIEAHIE